MREGEVGIGDGGLAGAAKDSVGWDIEQICIKRETDAGYQPDLRLSRGLGANGAVGIVVGVSGIYKNIYVLSEVLLSDEAKD